MFRRRGRFTRTFQFPLNTRQTRDFVLCSGGLYLHWSCPECSWEFHAFAQSEGDFEYLIENHERETHDV